MAFPKSSHKLDFTSCAIKDGFHKSSHILWCNGTVLNTIT